MISFMREEREHMKDERAEMDAKLEKQRLDAEAKLETQRKEAEAKLEKQRQEHTCEAEAKLEAQRKEADAKLEKQRDETEKLHNETESLREQARVRTASEAISEEQLEALQSRLVALHEAKLLTDEESDTAEDITIDCLELLAKAPMTTLEHPTVDKVRTMLVLSEKVAADRAFARQLRRKVL
jgi:hypothetical protein